VPFALDIDALTARVERAVAMLARADDERVIRLHPDDLKLVAGKLDQQWAVLPDPALARGELRVETANGGVEDGPAQWRRALAEAFEAC
jgi:flagellar assembly protein FliH